MKRGLVMVMSTIAVLTADGKCAGTGPRAALPRARRSQCDVLGDWGRDLCAAHRRGRSHARRQVRIQAHAGAAKLR